MSLVPLSCPGAHWDSVSGEDGVGKWNLDLGSVYGASVEMDKAVNGDRSAELVTLPSFDATSTGTR